MRTVVLLALTAAAVSASSQTATLVCNFGGKDIGTGIFTMAPQRDQSYIETTEFKIELNGQKIEIRSVVKMNVSGMTLHEDEKELINGVVQKDVSILFNLKGAVVTDKATGVTKTYPVPVGAKTKDLSGLWFVSSKPKIGDKSTATAFSADTCVWRKTTRTYVGDKSLTIGGKTVVSHQLKDETEGKSIVALVDDHGLPLDINISEFHFVRK